jgi:hypothetical protein
MSEKDWELYNLVEKGLENVSNTDKSYLYDSNDKKSGMSFSNNIEEK